jgi:hypothetical protein
VITALGEFKASAGDPPPGAREEGWLLLRPAGGLLHSSGTARSACIGGIVLEANPFENSHRITLRCAENTEVYFFSEKPIRLGKSLCWEPGNGVFLR